MQKKKKKSVNCPSGALTEKQFNIVIPASCQGLEMYADTGADCSLLYKTRTKQTTRKEQP